MRHDAPNYTPRISSVLHIENNEYSYAMSILKSHNGNPDICERHTYTYDAAFAGEGHYIHTYMGDGNPLQAMRENLLGLRYLAILKNSHR